MMMIDENYGDLAEDLEILDLILPMQNYSEDFNSREMKNMLTEDYEISDNKNTLKERLRFEKEE